VERALSLTQLDDVADRQVKTYSMGMRQRLSISTAILKAPDLLILDEPTNGLDPRGGHAIRRMLRKLADDGMTVLVSSHILAELEQFVDDVSIIAAGKCVLSGPLAELTAQPRHALVVRVKAHQVDPAKRVLAAHGVPVSSAGADGRLDVDSDDGETVNRVLCDEGIYAHAIYTRSSPLEDVFLRVTQAPGGARE
jgi:ABC-2 type transport system ATP-binding protein